MYESWNQGSSVDENFFKVCSPRLTRKKTERANSYSPPLLGMVLIGRLARVDKLGWGAIHMRSVTGRMRIRHWVETIALLLVAGINSSAFAQSGSTPKLVSVEPKITVDSECITTRVSGSDERLFLVNKCAEPIRYAACQITVDGSDNCFPMAIQGTPTIWPIGAGSSVATFPMKRLRSYSVIGCPSPLIPWDVVWDNVRLSGRCVDENMQPMKAAGPNSSIPLVGKPETWPSGTTNDSCLTLSDTLYQYTMQLNVRCETEQNLIVCMDAYPASGLATPLIPFHSCTGMADYDPLIPENLSAVSQTMIASPNRISKWAAFGCPAPLVPKGLSFDGRFIHGRCESPDKPKEPDIFASLPKRKADKAKTLLSDSLDTEQGASRAQIAANEVTRRQGDIEERARQSNAIFGSIVSTVAQTYVQYELAKAQQTIVLPPVETSGSGGSSNTAPAPNNSSSGSGVNDEWIAPATNCVQVSEDTSKQKSAYTTWVILRNSCSYEVYSTWANGDYGSDDFNWGHDIPAGGTYSATGKPGKMFSHFACPTLSPLGKKVSAHPSKGTCTVD